MNTIGRFAYFEMEIDKMGNRVDRSSLSLPLASPIRDLFVISHGWNSNIDDARALYRSFFAQFGKTLAAHAPEVIAGECAVLGLLWPSMKCTDSSLIPGGAASLDAISGLAGPAGARRLESAKRLLPVLDQNPAACREFVDLVRSVLAKSHDDEGTHLLFGEDGGDLLSQFRPATYADHPEGGAADLGILPGSLQRAAAMFLNTTAYYLMKDRAGIVGRNAVAAALEDIQERHPGLRIHLIGHSFGSRVVTSACSVVARPVASMTLLQAAFSHNSFSPDFDSTHQPGGFRGVITGRKCSGPIVVTHSRHDMAVGLGYAVASRAGKDRANALGAADDIYGGLGRNGARHTPEASDEHLLPEGAGYAFKPGHITNLQADEFIKGHSDVVKPETAWALIAAAGLLARPFA